MASTSRHDGRQNAATRELSMSYDGLARVDGSARFGFGTTSALASLSGPIEVRLNAEQPSTATFEVLLRPLSNVPATEAKSLGATLRAALAPSLILTKNPRTLVQLVIQCLSALPMGKRGPWKEGMSAAMINAGTLALLNAGAVPMRGVVCAVTLGRLRVARTPKSVLVVDPGEEEVEALEGGGCFAFLFTSGEEEAQCVWTSWRSTSGVFDETELGEARDMARVAAKDVYGAVRESIERMKSRPAFTFDEKVVKDEIKDVMDHEEEEEEEEEEDDDDKMEI